MPVANFNAEFEVQIFASALHVLDIQDMTLLDIQQIDGRIICNFQRARIREINS